MIIIKLAMVILLLAPFVFVISVVVLSSDEALYCLNGDRLLTADMGRNIAVYLKEASGCIFCLEMDIIQDALMRYSRAGGFVPRRRYV
ncbi:MAG: hypothetical protein PHV77_06310 [Candidatus Omnitrophica bacterium]|nr:hypothetical protein [Candidatus Omnitrophota bacterium]